MNRFVIFPFVFIAKNIKYYIIINMLIRWVSIAFFYWTLQIISPPNLVFFFLLLSLCLADTEFNICVKQNNLIGIVINTVFDMFWRVIIIKWHSKQTFDHINYLKNMLKYWNYYRYKYLKESMHWMNVN